MIKTVFEAAERTEDNFIGATSLIIYTVFVLVTVKYIAFVLRADNKGEGGTFSLLGLIKGTDEPNSSIDIEKKSGNTLSLIKISTFCDSISVSSIIAKGDSIVKV